jgi:hypothetical protein
MVLSRLWHINAMHLTVGRLRRRPARDRGVRPREYSVEPQRPQKPGFRPDIVGPLVPISLCRKYWVPKDIHRGVL